MFNTYYSTSALTACASGLARLVTGSLSNQLMVRGKSRTYYFPLMMLVMAAGHATLCLPGPVALLVGTALAGWAFGSCFPLLVLTVNEIFGSARLASNYMIFDGSPGAVGAIVFAKFVYNAVFDAHKSDDGTCSGDACFTLSHVLIVATQLAVGVLGWIFSRRVQVVYDALQAKGVELNHEISNNNNKQ